MIRGTAAFYFLGFVRIIQPHQLLPCRHPPVRIIAPTIVLAIGLGVHPIHIAPVVPRRPHQVSTSVKNRPVVIGDEMAVPFRLLSLLHCLTFHFLLCCVPPSVSHAACSICFLDLWSTMQVFPSISTMLDSVAGSRLNQ
jgi:hypothetical protein